MSKSDYIELEGVVKEKLGKKDEAFKRKKIVKDYLTKSDYWIQRFKTLNLKFKVQ